jgi:hypothetical protein
VKYCLSLSDVTYTFFLSSESTRIDLMAVGGRGVTQCCFVDMDGTNISDERTSSIFRVE